MINSRERTMAHRSLFGLMVVLSLCGLPGCDSGEPDPPSIFSDCIVSTSLFVQSTDLDAIPPLTDPNLVAASEAGHVKGGDLIIGLVIDDLVVALPRNILQWHEVVNFNTTSPKIAVTYCPLTGSATIIDRSSIGDVSLGNSGLLFLNNNVMYDDSNVPSLWPQMTNGAVCGPDRGKSFTNYPVQEMTWSGWRALYPETMVLSDDTGFERDYETDQLAAYRVPSESGLFYPMPSRIDPRRPPKDRVLGIVTGDIPQAFPLREIYSEGALGMTTTQVDGRSVLVLGDGSKQTASAFYIPNGSSEADFSVGDGGFLDAATGTTWRVDGKGMSGPGAGQRLEQVLESYTVMWFAWAGFHSSTSVWTR